MQHLSVIPDPRIDRNKKHDLAEMLFVAVCATLSGAEGWADIVEFAENRLDWLRRFIRLENGVSLDCFLSWLEDLRETNGGRLIAIDGKTLRRSYDRKRGRHPLHLVRAWATEQGLALGCVKTED